MSATKAEESRRTQKSLRQLLQDYPDSGQRVIGEGTVHVDAEKIRQSKKYQEMVAKVRKFTQAQL